MSKAHADQTRFNYEKTCPKCHAPTDVLVKGWGGWSEDRVCDKGHEFHVEYTSSNDYGAVTWGRKYK